MNLLQFQKSWDGKMFHSFTTSSHSKVCIMLKKNLDAEIISQFNDNDGRKLLLNVKFGDEVFTVVNLYCPTDVKSRVEFLVSCKTWIKNHSISDENLLVGGDLNCVDNNIDKKSKYLDKSACQLTKLKRYLGVEDSWRKLHPDKVDYTYIDPSYRGYNSRIDLIMVSKLLSDFIELCEHKPAPTPDHKAVIVQICKNINERGKGYWKLNTSVIEEENYKLGIRQVITSTCKEYSESLTSGKLWEFIKIRIK